MKFEAEIGSKLSWLTAEHNKLKSFPMPVNSGKIGVKPLQVLFQGAPSKPRFGRGTYLIKIKLDRIVPNIVPMYGLLIKVSHKNKQKSSVQNYHKPSSKF